MMVQRVNAGLNRARAEGRGFRPPMDRDTGNSRCVAQQLALENALTQMPSAGRRRNAELRSTALATGARVTSVKKVTQGL